MSKYRVALSPENQSCLARSATQHGRSAVKELNYLLAVHFAANPPPPVRQAQELSPLRMAASRRKA